MNSAVKGPEKYVSVNLQTLSSGYNEDEEPYAGYSVETTSLLVTTVLYAIHCT